MPTVILQFPVGYGQYLGLNFPCAHCGQHAGQQTNEIKEEKIEPKEEKQEIKEEINLEDKADIKEEFIFDYDKDDNILYNNPNFYENKFSPISNANSENSENDNFLPFDQHDEMSDSFYEKCFNEIMELVEYLKEDTIYNN